MKTQQYSPANPSLTVLIFGSIMLMGGCFVPLNYDVSVLQEIPPGFEVEIHKDVAQLNLPELTLLVQVQSFNWDDSYMPGPLGIWLDLEPLHGPVTLDTRAVMLKSDVAKPLRPISYLGPSTAWWSPRAFAAGCGPRVYRTGISISNSAVLRQSVLNAGGMQGVHRPSSQAVSISDKSCFMFWFATDPHPDHVFVLSITGVKANGVPLSVPALRFGKGTVSTVRGFP